MSLKGLGKGERQSVDEFIRAAPNQASAKSEQEEPKAKEKPTTGRGFKPVTLSLNEGWSGLLDELSCRTKRVRASRSDIVRIGMMMVSRLESDQLDALIKESRNIPDEDLLEGDFIASCDAIPELLKRK